MVDINKSNKRRFYSFCSKFRLQENQVKSVNYSLSLSTEKPIVYIFGNICTGLYINQNQFQKLHTGLCYIYEITNRTIHAAS